MGRKESASNLQTSQLNEGLDSFDVRLSTLLDLLTSSAETRHGEVWTADNQIKRMIYRREEE
jgi:hypothetical protein